MKDDGIFNLAIRFYDNALSTLAKVDSKNGAKTEMEKEKISV